MVEKWNKKRKQVFFLCCLAIGSIIIPNNTFSYLLGVGAMIAIFLMWKKEYQ